MAEPWSYIALAQFDRVKAFAFPYQQKTISKAINIYNQNEGGVMTYKCIIFKLDTKMQRKLPSLTNVTQTIQPN